MKIILVEDGNSTIAVYDAFYKHKLGTYKVSSGWAGLMDVLGVQIVKEVVCENPSNGKLVDEDGFPYHFDNLPTQIHAEKKTRRKRKNDKKP